MAPHLTRKMTSAKIKWHPDDKFHDPSVNNNHFSKQDWHCDDFRLRGPVIQKNVFGGSVLTLS